MAIVKVNWSGGKDSSCAVMKHIEADDFVKVVCYVPMFTEIIPLISKKHYDFILNTAALFRSLGAEVHIVTGITYCDQVRRRSTRGKFKGRIFGFPSFKKGLCHFKRDSKIKALQQIDIGSYDYEDIGIAADETDRHGQLTDTLRSILCEQGITEKAAVCYCIERDIYIRRIMIDESATVARFARLRTMKNANNGSAITRKRSRFCGICKNSSVANGPKLRRCDIINGSLMRTQGR